MRFFWYESSIVIVIFLIKRVCVFILNAAYSSTGKWKKNNKIIKCQEQNCKAGPRIVCCYCGRNPVCFIIKFNITCSSINKNLRAHPSQNEIYERILKNNIKHIRT